MRPFGVALTVVGLLLTGMSTEAAAQRKSWGLTASLVPSWKTVDQLKILYGADRVDLSGGEFRVGIVRGRSDKGDWGLSFVQKTFKAGGVIENGTQRFVLDDGVVMRGAVIHGAPVLGRIGDHFQIGLVFSAGAAAVKGSAHENGLVVDAKKAFQPFGVETSVQPLGGLELAAAIVAGPNFKVRMTGGFSWPGIVQFGIGGLYFFGR